MEIKQIKELMSEMKKHGLKRVRIKEEKGYELELERQGEQPAPVAPRMEAAPQFAPPVATPAAPKAASAPGDSGAKEGTYIDSPMVGTFYSSPSPEDPVFVKVGDEVDEDTVVCIIEAMKVMNEVKAGKKGKIVEMLPSNSDPVEFGTHLFRIV